MKSLLVSLFVIYVFTACSLDVQGTENNGEAPSQPVPETPGPAVPPIMPGPVDLPNLPESFVIVPPGASIQDAIDAAVDDTVVFVSAGMYEENIVISQRTYLVGGYGGNGDPYDREPGEFHTPISAADSSRPVIRITGPGAAGSVIEGFILTGGSLGIAQDSTNPAGNITIAYTIIEGNGRGPGGTFSGAEFGGGLDLYGNDFLVLNNIIQDNWGGKGAGIHSTGAHTLFFGNTVSGNDCFSNHGGGMYLEGAGIAFISGVVENNSVPAEESGIGYGFGGGIIINGYGTDIQLENTIIRFNRAASNGGGLDADSGATIYGKNLLIYGNEAGSHSPGIYISDGEYDLNGTMRAGTIFLENSTVFGNTIGPTGLPFTGCGLDARGGSAYITNCIFWQSHWDTFWAVPDDSYVNRGIPELGGNIIINYSIADDVVTGNAQNSQEFFFQGTGNSTSDPLFSDIAAFDVHLRSAGGRWDTSADSWVFDAQTSPAIDSGDPALPFDSEPEPNGGRVNIGYYGNTPQASKSLY